MPTDAQTPLEVRPAPPEPTRLNRRAGVAAFMVLGLLMAAIVYGVSTRQGVNMRGKEEQTRAESATNAGREIASRIGEGNLTERPTDRESRPPAPIPMASAPAPAPVAQAQEPTEMSPEERLREEAWAREQAAKLASTPIAKAGNSNPLGAVGTGTGSDPLNALLGALATGGQAGRPGAPNAAGLGGGGGWPGRAGGGVAPGSLAATLAAITGAAGGGGSPGEGFREQNNQSGKMEFNNAAQAMDDVYLKASRNAALSPYEVKAGWDIPAVLDQGVNSDLPGEMHALVRENVYDSSSGQFLLIPKGTRALGVYNSNVSFGQERVQVVWNRLIFPDGSSISLGNMVGQDKSGLAGFNDRVNNHWGRVIAGAVLSSLFSAGYQLSQKNRDNFSGNGVRSGDIAAASVGLQVSQVGSRLTERNLNIQPTLEIRPGYRFNIRVNKDMLFGGPYAPMAPLSN